MYAGRLGRRVRTSLAVRLDPGADTAVALATTVTLSFIYFFGARTDSALASFLVFTVLGTGITWCCCPLSTCWW
jgi:hypothetical protein